MLSQRGAHVTFLAAILTISDFRFLLSQYSLGAYIEECVNGEFEPPVPATQPTRETTMMPATPIPLSATNTNSSTASTAETPVGEEVIRLVSLQGRCWQSSHYSGKKMSDTDVQ